MNPPEGPPDQVSQQAAADVLLAGVDPEFTRPPTSQEISDVKACFEGVWKYIWTFT